MPVIKDMWLKALSLAIAVGLALFVHSESNTSNVTVVVPVETTNVPRDKIVVAPVAPNATVSLRGPSFLIGKVYSSLPPFRVTLPDEVGLRFKAVLEAGQLNLPPSVRATKIDPQEINYILDKRLSRKFPVEVSMHGAVLEGFKVDSIEVTPDSVEASGPEVELKSLSLIETLPIDMREVSAPLSRELGLRNPGRLTELKPGRVQVRINISALQGTRTFKGLEVQLRGEGASAFKADPQSVQVELGGGQVALEQMKASSLTAFVELTSGAAEGSEFSVDIDSPEGMVVKSVRPQKVRLVRADAATLGVNVPGNDAASSRRNK